MDLETNIRLAIERGKESGLTDDDIDKCLVRLSKVLLVAHHRKSSPSKPFYHYPLTVTWYILYRVLPLIALLMFLYQRMYILYSSEPCLLAQPVLSEFAMPIVNCTRCQDITNATEITDISIMEFMERYAYTLQPVLMKGAASDWPAVRVFSYNYFKELYKKKPEAIDHDVQDGQFFPYSSGIYRLDEFMALDNDTAALKGERWYIGWSTNEPFIGKELRKNLKEPYFLPPNFSDENLGWIFMGAPGPGASLHIDWVGRPSWQAQLSGKKTWTLAPPPECEQYCSTFNVTVNTGDIFIIDTNSWFHSTFIHSNGISITFGTEYD